MKTKGLFFTVSFVCFSVLLSFAQQVDWLWAKPLNSTGHSRAFGINVDANNRFFMTAFFNGTGSIDDFYFDSNGASDGVLVQGASTGVINYARIIGGKFNDFNTTPQSSVDNLGNVYFAGNGTDTVFANGLSIVVEPYNTQDVLVAKYNSSGDILWLKQLVSGDGNEDVFSIRTDQDGNIVLAGWTRSGTVRFIPDLVVDIDPLYAGKENGFVAKFTSSGEVIWANVFQGTASTKPNSVVVVGDDTYAVGILSGEAFFGNQKIVSRGGNDIYLSKIDNTGAVEWTTQAGHSGDDRGVAITSDNSGNVIIGGLVSNNARIGSLVLGNEDTLRVNGGSSVDYFLASFDEDGRLNWSLNNGGAGLWDAVYDITVYDDVIYVVGETTGSHVVGYDTVNTTSATNKDILFVKYSTNGKPIGAISTPGIGNNPDFGQAVAVGPDKSPYITGFFRSPSIVFDNHTLTNPNPGTNQVFIAKACPHVDLQIYGVPAGDICSNASMLSLEAAPAGGVFSGQGVSGSSFNPAGANIGTNYIRYDYTNPQNGCTYRTFKPAKVVAAPAVSFSGLEPVYCPAAEPAELTGSPEGGVFSGPGISGSTVDFSQAGTGSKQYSYTFTDSETGCSATAVGSTNINTTLQLSISGLAATYCLTTDSYALTGSPAGGVFSAAKGQIDGNLYTPSTEGADTVWYSLPDADGCINTTYRITTVHSPAPLSIIPPDAQMCKGSAMTLIASMSGSNSFVWSTGATGSSISVAPLGDQTYSVTATDVFNCVQSAEIEVIINEIPQLSFSSISPACGVSDGSITVIVTGENGPFTVLWDDNDAQETETAADLASGLYTVSVDDGFCPVSKSFLLKDGGALSIDLSHNEASICQGETFTVTSDEPIGTYSWSPIDAVEKITGDDYKVILKPLVSKKITVSRTEGACVAINYIDVTVRPLPNASITAFKTEICAGETAIWAASGGNTYEWSHGFGTNASAIVSLLETGDITVTATGLNGCSASASKELTIKQLPVLEIFNVKDSYCKNEPSASLEGNKSPAGLFSINNNVVTALNPALYPVGNHTLAYHYTDNVTGCKSIASHPFSIKQAPAANFTGLAASYCSNADDVQLAGTPEGGLFEGAGLTGSVFSPSSLAAGTYTITYTFTDAEGCASVSSKQVEIKQSPSLQFNNLASEYCVSDPAFGLSASPMPTFFRINGNISTTGIFNPSALAGGQNTVSFSYTHPNNGCVSTLSKEVAIADFEIDFPGLKEKYCNNEDPFVLQATPAGGTFKLNNTVATTFNPFALSGLVNLEYSVSQGGCSKKRTIYPEVISYPSNLQFTNLNDSYCIDAAPFTVRATFDIDPVASMAINGNDTRVFDPQALGAGTHIVEYSYTNGGYCVGTITKAVSVYGLPSLSIDRVPAAGTICEGASALLVANAGAGTYAWSNGSDASSITLTPEVTTSYTLTFTDHNNCKATASTDITVESVPVISLAALSNPSGCNVNDGSIAISASAGSGSYTYKWAHNSSLNNPIATNLKANNYTVSVSNNTVLKCSSQNTFELLAPESTTISVTLSATSICAGGSVTADATVNKGNVTWLKGNPLSQFATGTSVVISPDETLNYRAYVYDITSNCGTDYDFTINVNPVPTATISATKESLCAGQSTTLTASGGTSYQWSNGSKASAITVSPGASQTYFVTAQNEFGCLAVAEQEIIVNPLPSVVFTDFGKVCRRDAAFELTNASSDIPGNYSGIGVSSNIFNPAVSGTGNFNITFTTNADDKRMRKHCKQNTYSKPKPCCAKHCAYFG
jgi:hypothetical protein